MNPRACCLRLAGSALLFLASPAVLAANRPPDARDVTFDLDEDGKLTAPIKVSDGDGDTVTFTMKKPPKNGEATLTPDGKLTYTPRKDWHGKDGLVFEVTDGKARAARKLTFAVSSVNDPPVVAGPLELAGQEDKPVKGALAASDADKDPMTFSVAEEPAGGSVTVDARSGKLQLVPAANVNGKVTFTLQVSDGTVEIKVPVTVVLAPVNDAPIAREVSAKGKEDQVITDKLIAEDVDGEPLTFTLAGAPAHGKVEIDAKKGTFAYTPAKEFYGDDSFGFMVTDGKSSAKSRVAMEVLNVNDPPTISPLVLEGVEDSPAKGRVLAKDFDGDEVYFTVKLDPKSGDVDIDRSTGEIVYTPAPNFSGTDALTIEASDIGGGATALVSVKIKPQNDAPVASSDSMKGDEDHPIAGKLRGADIDKDGLVFSLARASKSGTVDVKPDGTFRYMPNGNFNGEDAFQFEVSDGMAKAQGTMELTVKPVNDAPRGSDLKLATNEDVPARGTATAADIDKDSLTWSLARKSKRGRVELDEERGTFVYTPGPHENGDDSFALKVSDGALEHEVTVSVSIAAVNDAPVAQAGEAKGDEDQPIQGKLAASDVDKDVLTWTLAAKPRSGTATVEAATGAYTYTPAAHFNGVDSFRFETTDGKLKSSAEVKLAITAVNDPPEPKSLALTTSEDKAVTGTVSASDVDRDKLAWSLGKPPAKGKAVVDEATGRVTYTPDADKNGEDAFVVVVSDGSAKQEATVTVAIAPVNDAPVAQAHEASGDEDTPIQGKLTGSDVDADRLSFAAITKPRAGALELDAATGSYTYTPKAHFNGSDGFRFEVNDGKLKSVAEVKLVVAAVNDAPDVKHVALTTSEDKPVAGAVPASDVDRDKLTWSLGKAPAKGKVVVDERSGRVAYTPNQDANGEDSFVVVTSDGNAKVESTVSLAITPVNDAPVAQAHEASGNEDAPIKGKLTGSDVDGDTLTFLVTSKPRAGTVDLDAAAGAFTYTPNAHANGNDGFRFEVSDGKLRAHAEVKVAVAPVNDVPEPREVAAKTAEDKDVVGRVPASDIDRDTLTFRLKKPAQKGEVVVDDASGSFRFVPARNANGADAFVVEVTDGFATADATVKVEIIPVPDLPVVDPRPVETTEDEPVTMKLTALDPDGEEVLFRLVTQSSLGAAEIAGDGKTLKLVPRPDMHGEDRLIVEAFGPSDGKGSTRAVLPVRVAAKNDAPVLDVARGETHEEAPIEVALLARDKDGDPVKLALADKEKPKGAEVKIVGNLLHVTPARDFAGPVDVGVVPSDGAAGATMRVIINVTNVNDPPAVKDLALNTEAGKAVSGTVEASDVDAGDELGFSVSVPPRQGTVVIDDAKAGRFTYTPSPQARGEDSFRIRVRDKAGASVSATVKITIAGAKTVAAAGS